MRKIKIRVGDVVKDNETGQLMSVEMIHPGDSNNCIGCVYWDGKRFLRGRTEKQEIQVAHYIKS